MTKENVEQRIKIILNALNNVMVSGKQNLGNLSGSITLLEEIQEAINDGTIDIINRNTDN